MRIDETGCQSRIITRTRNARRVKVDDLLRVDSFDGKLVVAQDYVGGICDKGIVIFLVRGTARRHEKGERAEKGVAVHG